MATKIVLPDQKTDEVKDNVDEEGKTVGQESVSPSMENTELHEEQKPTCVESSSSEGPAIQLKEKTGDKQIDPPTVEVEKVYDTHGLNVSDIDVSKVTEASNLIPNVLPGSKPAVEVVEKDLEGQSILSESSVEAGDKHVEDLKVPSTREMDPEEEKKPDVGKESQTSELVSMVVEKPEPAGEQPEVLIEAVEGTEVEGKLQEQTELLEDVEKKSTLEVEEKPEEQTRVLEEVETKPALEVEQKMQEQTVLVEEVEKKPALVAEEKPQQQTGVVEEVEKKPALEVEEKLQEQTVVLEEVDKKHALEVDKKLQEQVVTVEEVEKKPGLEVEETPLEQTGILEEVKEKSTSEVEEASQQQTGVVEGEVEKKLALEVEDKLHEHPGVVELEVEKNLALEVVGKPQEQNEVLEEPQQKSALEGEMKPQEIRVLKDEVEKKSETPESKDTDGVVAKGEGTLFDKIELVFESLKEEQATISEEPALSEKLDAGVQMNQEAPSDAKDVVPTIVANVEESASVDDTKKEHSSANVVDGLPKEPVVEVGKVKEEKNIEDENASKLETQNSVDVSDSASAVEVAKESLKGKNASENVGVVVEEKKEDDVKGDIETTKDRDIGVGVDLVHATDTVKEPTGESKQLEPKKYEEAVGDELHKVVEPVEETAKSVTSNLEPSKDVNDLNTVGVMTKQEAPAKSTQKQSNNLISKVKHSIVKVKKAITGKSPSSKTISTDAKGDINVK